MKVNSLNTQQMLNILPGTWKKIRQNQQDLYQVTGLISSPTIFGQWPPRKGELVAKGRTLFSEALVTSSGCSPVATSLSQQQCHRTFTQVLFVLRDQSPDSIRRERQRRLLSNATRGPAGVGMRALADFLGGHSTLPGVSELRNKLPTKTSEQGLGRGWWEWLCM